MASEEKINIKLAAQTGAFQQALRGALGDLDKFGGGIFKNTNLMVGLGTAAVGAVTGLVALAVKTADTGDELLKMSDQTGLSVEKLSLLRFAAEQSDTSMESLGKGLERLSQNMVDTERGLATAQFLFDELGIAAKGTNGELRPMEDVLLDVADSFKGMENGAQKSGLAVKLFGSAGKDMIPFLNQGREGIAALTEQAREMGLEFSTESAEAASVFRDEVNELKNQLRSLWETVGKAIIPILSAMLEKINDTINVIRRFKESFDNLLASSPFLQKAFAAITGSAQEMGDSFQFANEWQDKITAAQRRQIEAALAGNSVTRQTTKELIESLKQQLEAKRRIQDFDGEYVEIYADLLDLQGKTNAQAQEIIGEDIAKRVAKAKEKEFSYAEVTEEMLLRILGAQESTDEQRIKAAEELSRRLEDQTEEDIQNYRDSLDKQEGAHETFQSAVEVGVRGLGDAIKGIWNDTGTDFGDVWRGALDHFIDMTAQMVVQAIITGKAVQIEMAAATAGISLAVGALASLIGGSGSKGPSKIELAHEELERSLETFLRNIERSIDAFLDETTGALESLARKTDEIKESFESINDVIDELGEFFGEGKDFPGLLLDKVDTKEILDNLDKLRPLIVERYRLEEGLIKDVMGLLKSQGKFAKSLENNIKEVERAFLNPKQIFDALKGDVEVLEQLVNTTTGEAQIEALGDLQNAYNDLFRQAQEAFAGDPTQLAKWQDFVLDGLEAVKDTGVDAYDQLIDVALADLDLTRESLFALTQQTDLQKALEVHLDNIAKAADLSLTKLEEMGETLQTGTLAELKELNAQLTVALDNLGINRELPSLHQGGIATRKMVAQIAEAGPEAIIPLSRLGSMGGVTMGSVTINLPNIRRLEDFSEIELTNFFKGKLLRVANDLNRHGYQWPMKVSENRLR